MYFAADIISALYFVQCGVILELKKKYTLHLLYYKNTCNVEEITTNSGKKIS